jgi:hypothetical protein
VNTHHWQLEGLAEEQAKWEIKQKNIMFRKRLRKMKNAKEVKTGRDRLMKIASVAACVPWVYVGIQWLS